MVWWKALLKVICSIILVASLILFVITFSLLNTLTKENLQPVIVDMFKEGAQTNETEFVSYYSMLVQNCTATGAETIEAPLGEGPEAQTVTLKCSDISAGGPSGLIDLMADAIFNKIYYKKYECSFIECFTGAKEEEQIYVFISDFARSFFKTVSYFGLVAAAVMIALIFFLSTPKATALTCLGTDFIAAGIPFFVVKAAQAKIPVPEFGSLLIAHFFALISTYFIIALITGIVLLIAGIIIGIARRKKKGEKT